MQKPPQRIMVITCGQEDLPHRKVHADYNKEIDSSKLAEQASSTQEAAFCVFDLRDLIRNNRVHSQLTLDGECLLPPISGDKKRWIHCRTLPALVVAILFLNPLCIGGEDELQKFSPLEDFNQALAPRLTIGGSSVSPLKEVKQRSENRPSCIRNSKLKQAGRGAGVNL